MMFIAPHAHHHGHVKLKRRGQGEGVGLQSNWHEEVRQLATSRKDKDNGEPRVVARGATAGASGGLAGKLVGPTSLFGLSGLLLLLARRRFLRHLAQEIQDPQIRLQSRKIHPIDSLLSQ